MENNNPYAAPEAELTKPVANQTLLQEPRSLDVSYGWHWMKDAWRIFAQYPLLWVGIGIVYSIILMASSMVPFATNIVMPMLIGGMMLGCKAQNDDKPLDFKYLFDGFNVNAGQLALLGVFSLIALIVVMMLMFLLFGIGAAIIIPIMENSEPSGTFMSLLMLLAFLLYLAITLPIMMALWFSPALVIIHNVDAINALKLSFKGCLRNIMPFLWLSIILMGITVLACAPLFLGLFVLIPLWNILMYSSYKDVFLENA